MKRHLLLLLLLLSFELNLFAQPLSSSFEIRYFTDNPSANGETDFKGETEWLNTEQRISFLEKYADFASSFFKNPDLDKEIVNDGEIKELLSRIKPQPLTTVRKTIPLEGWKSYGYKKGADTIKKRELELWEQFPGTVLSEGKLKLENTIINRNIDSLKWRFSAECKVKTINNDECFLSFSDRECPVFSIEIKKGEINCTSNSKLVKKKIDNNEWTNLLVEGDLTQKRFNLYVNDTLFFNYIPMMENTSSVITNFSIRSEGISQIDDIFIFNQLLTEEVCFPYISKVVIDENFEEKPDIDGWQKINFDDRKWIDVTLPAVHGGIREKDEDFYLRKKVFVENYERATLKLETLTPGGEVWINNEVVAVINDRHPYEIEVSEFLKKNQENIIAIKVKPYYANFPMAHASTDPYVGWFLGRTTLILSSKCMITNAEIATGETGNTAFQKHKINIQYSDQNYLDGKIEVNYYPWIPVEGEAIASFSQQIRILPQISNEYNIEFPIPSPNLWSPEFPNLYKVEFILKDKNDVPIDDYITTTGIRKIDQRNGELLINGNPEMLNGAQIMGLRTPIETISKYNRCATDENVAEEMLMIKKMGANLLRMHVHAEIGLSDGINDPRYAELADQLGIYLIWTTSAWIRAAEVSNLDFEGYPKYMKQVINHPSIVIWEAANHPDKFKEHEISYTNDYIERIYKTIYLADQSRLISPTTFWQHTYYADYSGTIDFNKNIISPVTEYNEHLVTRGSQDAYSGYGNTWTNIRKAPYDFAASCLAANDKAYFNFEHEESAAQPNWELSKGKPWYLLQSYEWDYDEGSIGRRLTTDEWRISQAWQAFSAWESMKKQMLLGYDGFSWCCLHGGANMGTYQKPLIDNLRHPKLAFYINQMVFQKNWGGSNNVDVVYGPGDEIIPVIHHLGKEQNVNLCVTLKDLKGKALEKKQFKNINLRHGRELKQMEGFRFKNVKEGIYAIVYEIFEI